jgi:hypothetical protein
VVIGTIMVGRGLTNATTGEEAVAEGGDTPTGMFPTSAVAKMISNPITGRP